MTTSDVTFNIIEGDYTLTFPYEEIKEDYYNSSLLVEEIKKKYQLSKGDWKRFRKQLKEEGLPLKTVRNRMGTGKYFYWCEKRGMYKVQRHFKRKTVFFGYYPTEEAAQARIDELNRNGWEGYL